MGSGGPAKAAEPKVTPFVEPAGPKNPIPNWFGGQPGTGGSGTYSPDFSRSAGTFGGGFNPAPAPPAQAYVPAPPPPSQTYAPAPVPAYQPMPALQAPQGGYPAPAYQPPAMEAPDMPNPAPYTPFAIPTPQPSWQGWGDPNRQITEATAARRREIYGWLPDIVKNMMRSHGFGGGPATGAPRYRNYTDTNRALSTDAAGAPIDQPEDSFGGTRRNLWMM